MSMTEAQGESGERMREVKPVAPPVGPELSVVIPTLNEIENVPELLSRLDIVLDGISWEAVFVDDDSPDGTAGLARKLGRADARVRCLHRIGRRGLSSACIEGMLSSCAPYVAVMDADLQHDEGLLPRMLEALKSDDIDIVYGSRYAEGGGTGGWDESRLRISRFANWLSALVVRAELSDPMSGFFMLKRDVLDRVAHRLSGIGFKILLDLFASAPEPLRFRELPYEFRARHAGESKLDTLVAWEYGMLLLDKLIGHIVPVRFVAFAAVGGLGLIVHMLVLSLAHKGFAVEFNYSQVLATLVAMTFNYFVNNLLTYRDRRQRGWTAVRGLITFYLACSVGALSNVGVAVYLFAADQAWWIAGVAGVVVGAVWNYAVTSVFTWSKPSG